MADAGELGRAGMGRDCRRRPDDGRAFRVARTASACAPQSALAAFRDLAHLAHVGFAEASARRRTLIASRYEQAANVSDKRDDSEPITGQKLACKSTGANRGYKGEAQQEDVGTQRRSAVVQGRDHLSGAHQVVLRCEQRRHRRLPGLAREAGLHRGTGRRYHLAAAVLSLAAP
ncbi:hypothetical protein BURKHO8Y_170042 [Burkholderia sp. 8Y]|nr:hypothetical protein BURKHO8Y_170042 [Burkholderia sp. 8Y]